MSFIDKNTINNAGDLVIDDDGTYIKVSVGGTDLFRIRKSDGQMQVAGGYDSDVSL